MLLDWRVVTEPQEEPVTLAEAKAHCRVLHSAEDDLLSALIVAARQHVEQVTWRALVTQVRQVTLDRWPSSWRDGTDAIALPGGTVSEVGSVKYTGSNGAEVTLDPSGYHAALAGDRPLVYPAWGTVWPTTRDEREAVRVQYTTGYGAAADVPQGLKQAMLLLIGHWYANREASVVGTITAELPQAVGALLAPYRLMGFS
jgi:uncharacterized phiE125 gp8 family phage protein